ncbi:MAG: hypothetical protein D6732_03530, partial [Methanobacteriota archaeon]
RGAVAEHLPSQNKITTDAKTRTRHISRSWPIGAGGGFSHCDRFDRDQESAGGQHTASQRPEQRGCPSAPGHANGDSRASLVDPRIPRMAWQTGSHRLFGPQGRKDLSVGQRKQAVGLRG